MPKTRVLYASKALFVGPSPASTQNHTPANTRQIFRAQSSSWDFNIARQNVEQLGNLAALSREIVDAPTVNLNFSWLATNAYNESGIGLVTNGQVSAIASLLNKTADEKNYFILTAPEGVDANDSNLSPDQYDVIGIGNGFLSSYSFEAAVGGFPTVSCKVEALNVDVFGTASGANIPAVNPTDGSSVTGYTFVLPNATSGIAGQVTALRPGDITLSLASVPLGVDINDAKVQRVTIGFDLQREPQQKLGSRFAFSREIRFPVTVTMSVDATLGDLVTGSLASVLCNDVNYDLAVSLKKPSCDNNGAVALRFDVKGAKLDTQNDNLTIGPNESVALTWSTQIGSAQQTSVGLFISGVQN